MIRETIDELAALGWKAILHGPEAHLALPFVYALAAAVFFILKGGNKRRK